MFARFMNPIQFNAIEAVSFTFSEFRYSHPSYTIYKKNIALGVADFFCHDKSCKHGLY
jgi:hypothetical protein